MLAQKLSRLLEYLSSLDMSAEQLQFLEQLKEADTEDELPKIPLPN